MHLRDAPDLSVSEILRRILYPDVGPNPPRPHIPLQFPQSQQHRNISPPLSHIITRPGQQMRLNGRPLKNISPGKYILVPASINIPPSFITMVLLVYSATTPMSWLIRIIVFPASFNIFIRARNLFRCPRSCPVVGSSSTIIPDSMDNMEATASLCLYPRLSECGSIDEVLLNIKMRTQ